MDSTKAVEAPKKGDYPHPEYGSWPAERDGGCNTHYVAGAHPPGKRDAERLERRYALGVAGLVAAAEQRLEHEPEAPYLYESGAYREVDAGKDEERHQGRAPDHVVYGRYYFCKHICVKIAIYSLM